MTCKHPLVCSDDEAVCPVCHQPYAVVDPMDILREKAEELARAAAALPPEPLLVPNPQFHITPMNTANTATSGAYTLLTNLTGS